MLRELIGLISIVIGVILLLVSLYLSLHRIRARAGAPVARTALITTVYGLLFIAVGAIIEHTRPVTREPEQAGLPQSETTERPPETSRPDAETIIVDTGPAADMDETREKQELSRRMKEREPVQFRRKEEAVRPAPYFWTPEERIYIAVDALLRRIEEFFERYGTPVEMESSEPAVLSLRPIFFDDTTADIPPKYFPLLDQTARILRQHPEAGIIEVQAHTNGEGPEVYNFLITQSRANAVREYLVARGVEAERLVAKGYGTTAPCVISDSSRQTPNRRIEFVPISKPRTNRN